MGVAQGWPSSFLTMGSAALLIFLGFDGPMCGRIDRRIVLAEQEEGRASKQVARAIVWPCGGYDVNHH